MDYIDPKIQARRTQMVDLLERVCDFLELSPSQYALANQRYEGLGTFLAASEELVLRTVSIFLQGSTALRTTVKPVGVNEHDVDLVAHVPDLDVNVSPAALKKALGDRLRGSGHYAPLLEEMPRCWRLNSANEFHMDITPAIPNPACRFGGDLVPDKTLRARQEIVESACSFSQEDSLACWIGLFWPDDRSRSNARAVCRSGAAFG